jgi:hypothetical protein
MLGAKIVLFAIIGAGSILLIGYGATLQRPLLGRLCLAGGLAILGLGVALAWFVS